MTGEDRGEEGVTGFPDKILTCVWNGTGDPCSSYRPGVPMGYRELTRSGSFLF